MNHFSLWTLMFHRGYTHIKRTCEAAEWSLGDVHNVHVYTEQVFSIPASVFQLQSIFCSASQRPMCLWLAAVTADHTDFAFRRLQPVYEFM